MSDQPQTPYESRQDSPTEGEDPRFVVITPEGMGVATAPGSEGSAGRDTSDKDGKRERTNPAELVEEPAKVMRIGSMVKQLLEEVRSAPLDEQGRRRLVEIHTRSINELKDGLSPELIEELDRITLPFHEGEPASDAELRIAQAQLVGWLEGLFHGIQTALMAQQMALQAAQQQQQVRGALPSAAPGTSYGQPPGDPRNEGPTGQYL